MGPEGRGWSLSLSSDDSACLDSDTVALDLQPGLPRKLQLAAEAARMLAAELSTRVFFGRSRMKLLLLDAAGNETKAGTLREVEIMSTPQEPVGGPPLEAVYTPARVQYRPGTAAIESLWLLAPAMENQMKQKHLLTFRAKVAQEVGGREIPLAVDVRLTMRQGNGLFVRGVRTASALPAQLVAGDRVPAIRVQYVGETGELMRESHDELFGTMSSPTRCFLQTPTERLELEHDGNGSFKFEEVRAARPAPILDSRCHRNHSTACSHQALHP